MTRTVDLQIAAQTDTGHGREHNEDALLTLTPPDLPEELDALLCVADGMGGHQAGEVASKTVTETLAQFFAAGGFRALDQEFAHRADYWLAVISRALAQANARVYELAQTHAEWQGMGTTVTCALIAEGELYYGHIGDTRLYHLTEGRLKQVTEDHSWVQDQVRAGTMSAAEAENDERRHRLTRALGVLPTVEIDHGCLQLAPGDVVCLASDGLSNVVSDAEIEHYLKSAPDAHTACHALVELANGRGSPDNVTIALARVTSPARAEPSAEEHPGAKSSNERAGMPPAGNPHKDLSGVVEKPARGSITPARLMEHALATPPSLRREERAESSVPARGDLVPRWILRFTSIIAMLVVATAVGVIGGVLAAYVPENFSPVVIGVGLGAAVLIGAGWDFILREVRLAARMGKKDT